MDSNTPKTDTHHIDAIGMQIMAFHFCSFDPRWHLHFDLALISATIFLRLRARFIQERYLFSFGSALERVL